ncbi:MAG: type II secretion system major pseudopilin GspG [Planctomycetaceae bacterium]|nr:type II secretion system major pseudopilin GspG [Planctomycetaceae bacterium]
MKTRRPRRRGFTLMEVLLVLAILVVLGSMVTVGYLRLQVNANKDAARAQIGFLDDAIQNYALNIGSCPTTQQGLEALRVAPSDLRNPAKWAGPYLSQAIPPDPWGQPYQYEQISAEEFRIWSNGPDGQQGSEDDIDPARERQLNATGQ